MSRHRRQQHLSVRQILLQRQRIHRPLPLDDGDLLRHILQLPHIPGPPERLQHLHRVLRQTHRRHPVALREIRRKLPEQQRDILLPLPQGRHHDGYRIQAVKQILPELPVPHRIRNIQVRGGNHPHVRLLHLGRPHPDKLPALQHPQQPCLRRQGQLPHLVQEYRPPVRHLEIPLAVGHRPRERTLLVPEQLRVDGPLRYRPAIHRNIRRMLPHAVRMDDTRKYLLPRTALPRNQHRKVRRRHLDGDIDGTVQARRIPDNLKTLLDGLNIFHNPSFRNSLQRYNFLTKIEQVK